MGTEHRSKARRRAFLALALLVPAPSMGALAAFVLAPGPTGQSIYLACKLWIALLPLAWLVLVQRRPPSLSPLPRERRARGLLVGLGLGLVMMVVILGVWEFYGQRVFDVERLARVEHEAGLTTPGRYIAFALYIILVNSLLEEYVWRWFVFEHSEHLAGATWGTLLSAAFFTTHHVITFFAQMDPTPAALASLGVFLGGCCWSLCYRSFRSLWPGYLSHALADVAGLWIGWRILFGG